MNSVMQTLRGSKARSGIPVALLWLGLTAIGIPTAIDLYRSVLPTEDGQIVPIVLGVAIWLLARKWNENRSATVGGNSILSAIGLCTFIAIYIFGRIVDRISLELYSAFGIGVTAIYFLRGRKVLLQLSAPLVAILFAIPLPGGLLLAVTVQAKIWATDESVRLLHLMGMSVVQDGFNILVDQYVLAVKDACSGMNSIISLSWAGFVYVYLRREPGLIYYLLMFIPIIAVAIAANVVRIILLVLMTAFLGDAVAQGVLHETAGLVMFTLALSAVFILDWLYSHIAQFLARGRQNVQ